MSSLLYMNSFLFLKDEQSCFLKILSWLTGICFIDRTNTLNDLLLFPVTIKKPLVYTNTNKSLWEIVEHQTSYLLNNYCNIYFSWSGGIDSTCALISIINQLNDITRLKIVISNESILEYQNFYNYLKTNKFTIINISEKKIHLKKLIKPNDVFVTCEYMSGKCMSMEKLPISDTTYINKSEHKNIGIYDYFHHLLSNNKLSWCFNQKPNSNLFFEYLHSIITKAYYSSNNIWEFVHWLSYNCYYQYEWYRNYYLFCNGKTFEKTQFFFFDTQYFVDYLFNNNDRLLFGKYKEDFAQYIYKFTKDRNYYLYKKKGWSCLARNIHRNSIVAISSNYGVYYNQECRNFTNLTQVPIKLRLKCINDLRKRIFK